MADSLASNTPLVCVVDDHPQFNQALCSIVQGHGFQVIGFASALEFLSWSETAGDRRYLVISDIQMPGLSGYDLCRQLRARPAPVRIPIILITGLNTPDEKAAGLDAGADDFIQKPFSQKEMIAKLRSLLEIQAKEAFTWGELGQKSAGLGRLSHFLSPQVAEMVSSGTSATALEPHRAHVTVLFTDLRRFTAFSERVSPEETLEVLGRYYQAVGSVALASQGTLGNLVGDGVMVFFNDPVPLARHREIALQAALRIRELLSEQRECWRDRGYEIDFGIGLAEGYATIGKVGFEKFWQYTVIGSVTNFAARLCGAADGGQVLVSDRYLTRLKGVRCKSTEIGQLSLKGFARPVLVHDVQAIEESFRADPEAAA